MLVRWLVYPHITLKTDYVAIHSRLGFGHPLVVIEGTFYYEFKYKGTSNTILYCGNFVIEGVVIPRFQCT